MVKEHRGKRTKPTNNDWHGRVTSHSHQEKSCILERAVVVHRDQDCETGDCNTDSEDGVSESMACFVREVGKDHGEAEGSGPRRYTVKLSFDLAVAITVDN